MRVPFVSDTPCEPSPGPGARYTKAGVFPLPTRALNVGRIDIILILLRLMTFEALFSGIRHHRLLRIASQPELKAPAAIASIPTVAVSKRNTRAISPPALAYPIMPMVSSPCLIDRRAHRVRRG